MEFLNTAKTLKSLGTILIIAGIICGFYFGSDNSSFGYSLDVFILLMYILAGVVLGLLCRGFSRLVEAADKYLES